MNEQFRYIADLAKTYHQYSEEPDALFRALNELPEHELIDIFKEYSELGRFGPVNTLRIEVAHRLINGEKVSKDSVEEIKTSIRDHDFESFSHLPHEFQDRLKEPKKSTKDPFSMWSSGWSLFNTFFYRGKVKQTVQIYIDQISKQLLSDLELEDYQSHSVDFVGMRKTGADYCWIGLYPKNKDSHKDAHQFFLGISHEPHAGDGIGSNLGEWVHDFSAVNSYDDVLAVFKSEREEIVAKNEQLRNYFKFSQGTNPADWEPFWNEDVISADYPGWPLQDISTIKSLKELNTKAGFPQDDGSYEGSWNLWLLKSARVGDIAFVAKGRNTCIGICRIDGEYYYDEDAKKHKHRRKITWVTKKEFFYEPDSTPGIKALFRPDFFAPTNNWQFILSEYVRLYPELKQVFDENHLNYSTPKIDESVEPEIEETEVLEPSNFWWLNMNPRIWKVTELERGETKAFTSLNEKGNKRRIYKYFQAAKKGDLVIGYESSPTKQVNSILEVSKPLRQTEEGEVIEFALVEKLEIPVFWNELADNIALADCEVFKNNQGTLFRLTEDEFEIIRETLDNKNVNAIRETVAEPYSFENDVDRPFLSEKDFKQTVELLARKKNIILQGPPGVGKTFIARKLAYEMMGLIDDAQIEMVQFHQSFSYEDFIQGIRPSKARFVLKNGMFFSFCRHAQLHPERDFFFIIDGINRGNLSKIFGELMMLIEADKRGKKFELKLTYAEDEEDRFFVPPNVYLIGTMNTADRSLAIVDYALRRRFAFVDLVPTYNGAFKSFLQDNGASGDLVDHICTSVDAVNKRICEDIDLGAGFQIGHSYFCTKKPEDDEQKWFDEVIRFEIRPLLEEIWFDDLEKVDKAISTLGLGRANTN